MNDGMVASDFQGGGRERKEKKKLVILVYVCSYNLKVDEACLSAGLRGQRLSVSTDTHSPLRLCGESCN